MRMYGDNPRALARGLSTVQAHTCTTKSSVGLAHNGVSLAKDWVSVECGTIMIRMIKYD